MKQYSSSIQDVWDNIQIEVGAEFKKVKITLGELRQMSEGLVVDIAPVFQNEITLNVENKPVAKGELVIIDDRYGVKLTEVFKEEKEETNDNNDEDEEYIEEDGSSEEEGSEDDDFDYSDFEIDDEI